MDDLKDIKEELKTISETLVRNTATLEVHVARTHIAEKRLDALETFNRWWIGLMVSGILAVAMKLMLK